LFIYPISTFFICIPMICQIELHFLRLHPSDAFRFIRIVSTTCNKKIDLTSNSVPPLVVVCISLFAPWPKIRLDSTPDSRISGSLG
jgi:hypothetical protein